MVNFPPALVALDDSLFVQLNGRLHAPALDAVMGVLTALSEASWELVVVGVLLCVLLRGRARRNWVVAFITLALCDLLVDKALKPFFHRPRPVDAMLPVHAIAHLRHSLGFPSGHAANSACIYSSLATLGARRAWIAALASLAVGYSRIYVGVHRPLDVLGGWLFGLLVGWLVARWARSLPETFEPAPR